MVTESDLFREVDKIILSRYAPAAVLVNHELDILQYRGHTGPYLEHQLARIYILTGEPEKALDRLEPLLRTQYYLSPGWLRIDPEFDPLRKHPRFRKLVEGTAP